MITRQMVRQRDEEVFDLGAHDIPGEAALRSLVVYELGYGGIVIDVSPTHLIVRTQVLGSIDTTMFNGTEEEMRPLLEASAIVMEQVCNDQLSYDRIMRITGGSPLLIHLGADQLIGQARLQMAILHGIGVTDENDVRTCLELDMRDMVAAMELSETEGLTLPAMVRELEE